MAIELPYKHFFISEKVLEGAHKEKKEMKCEINVIAFYVLHVKCRDPERSFFTDEETYKKCLDLHKAMPFRKGVLESLQTCMIKTVDSITREESLLKLTSVIATKKAPETFAFLITPEEKKQLELLIRSKGYNTNLITTIELLNLAGIDYPFSRNFMSQLK